MILVDAPSVLEPPRIRPFDAPELKPENRNFVMMSSGMARTPGGRVWINWTGGGDNQDAHMLAAWSDDEGATWTDPVFLLQEPPSPHGFKRRFQGGQFWCDPLGRLWWLFDYSLGSFDGRAGLWSALCHNPDAKEPSWTTPRRLWHGSALDKPIVLDNGDWFLAVTLWQSDIIAGFPGQPWAWGEYRGGLWQELDKLRLTHAFVSKDQGATWERRGGVAAKDRFFDEPQVVQARGGALRMWLRTTYGLAETVSSDLGNTWSEPEPSALAHPSARILVSKLQSGRLLMVRHDAMTRSNLKAFLSDDDGLTWHGGLTLDERLGVSYPDGFQHPDGRVFVTYDHKRLDGELLLAVFTEDEVASGKGGKLRQVIKRTSTYKG